MNLRDTINQLFDKDTVVAAESFDFEKEIKINEDDIHSCLDLIVLKFQDHDHKSVFKNTIPIAQELMKKLSEILVAQKPKILKNWMGKMLDRAERDLARNDFAVMINCHNTTKFLLSSCGNTVLSKLDMGKEYEILSKITQTFSQPITSPEFKEWELKENTFYSSYTAAKMNIITAQMALVFWYKKYNNEKLANLWLKTLRSHDEATCPKKFLEKFESIENSDSNFIVELLPMFAAEAKSSEFARINLYYLRFLPNAEDLSITLDLLKLNFPVTQIIVESNIAITPLNKEMEDASLTILKEEIKKGNKNAQFHFAIHFYQSSQFKSDSRADWEIVLSNLVVAAKGGHAIAQYYVGALLWKISGVYGTSFIKSSADQKYPYAVHFVDYWKDKSFTQKEQDEQPVLLNRFLGSLCEGWRNISHSSPEIKDYFISIATSADEILGIMLEEQKPSSKQHKMYEARLNSNIEQAEIATCIQLLNSKYVEHYGRKKDRISITIDLLRTTIKKADSNYLRDEARHLLGYCAENLVEFKLHETRKNLGNCGKTLILLTNFYLEAVDDEKFTHSHRELSEEYKRLKTAASSSEKMTLETLLVDIKKVFNQTLVEAKELVTKLPLLLDWNKSVIPLLQYIKEEYKEQHLELDLIIGTFNLTSEQSQKIAIAEFLMENLCVFFYKQKPIQIIAWFSGTVCMLEAFYDVLTKEKQVKTIFEYKVLFKLFFNCYLGIIKKLNIPINNLDARTKTLATFCESLFNTSEVTEINDINVCKETLNQLFETKEALTKDKILNNVNFYKELLGKSRKEHADKIIECMHYLFDKYINNERACELYKPDMDVTLNWLMGKDELSETTANWLIRSAREKAISFTLEILLRCKEIIDHNSQDQKLFAHCGNYLTWLDTYFIAKINDNGITKKYQQTKRNYEQLIKSKPETEVKSADSTPKKEKKKKKRKAQKKTEAPKVAAIQVSAKKDVSPAEVQESKPAVELKADVTVHPKTSTPAPKIDLYKKALIQLFEPKEALSKDNMLAYFNDYKALLGKSTEEQADKIIECIQYLFYKYINNERARELYKPSMAISRTWFDVLDELFVTTSNWLTRFAREKAISFSLEILLRCKEIINKNSQDQQLLTHCDRYLNLLGIFFIEKINNISITKRYLQTKKSYEQLKKSKPETEVKSADSTPKKEKKKNKRKTQKKIEAPEVAAIQVSAEKDIPPAEVQESKPAIELHVVVNKKEEIITEHPKTSAPAPKSELQIEETEFYDEHIDEEDYQKEDEKPLTLRDQVILFLENKSKLSPAQLSAKINKAAEEKEEVDYVSAYARLQTCVKEKLSDTVFKKLFYLKAVSLFFPNLFVLISSHSENTARINWFRKQRQVIDTKPKEQRFKLLAATILAILLQNHMKRLHLDWVPKNLNNLFKNMPEFSLYSSDLNKLIVDQYNDLAKALTPKPAPAKVVEVKAVVKEAPKVVTPVTLPVKEEKPKIAAAPAPLPEQVEPKLPAALAKAKEPPVETKETKLITASAVVKTLESPVLINFLKELFGNHAPLKALAEKNNFYLTGGAAKKIAMNIQPSDDDLNIVTNAKSADFTQWCEYSEDRPNIFFVKLKKFKVRINLTDEVKDQLTNYAIRRDTAGSAFYIKLNNILLTDNPTIVIEDPTGQGFKSLAKKKVCFILDKPAIWERMLSKDPIKMFRCVFEGIRDNQPLDSYVKAAIENCAHMVDPDKYSAFVAMHYKSENPEALARGYLKRLNEVFEKMFSRKHFLPACIQQWIQLGLFQALFPEIKVEEEAILKHCINVVKTNFDQMLEKFVYAAILSAKNEIKIEALVEKYNRYFQCDASEKQSVIDKLNGQVVAVPPVRPQPQIRVSPKEESKPSAPTFFQPAQIYPQQGVVYYGSPQTLPFGLRTSGSSSS